MTWYELFRVLKVLSTLKNLLYLISGLICFTSTLQYVELIDISLLEFGRTQFQDTLKHTSKRLQIDNIDLFEMSMYCRIMPFSSRNVHVSRITSSIFSITHRQRSLYQLQSIHVGKHCHTVRHYAMKIVLCLSI